MARGLTHPTAHVGKPMVHKKTGVEYTYTGFKFFNDLGAITGHEVIETFKTPMKSGAVFKFNRNGKKYAIVYYGRSITNSTKISGGDIGLEYSGRKGATENLKITSDQLIKHGTYEKRILNGQEVECAVFERAADLKNSIIRVLKDNPDVGNHIVDSVTDYFNRYEKFDWSGFRESDINELGKYLGEVLIGVLVLDNKISGNFSQNIFQGGSRIVDFIVPNDPSFSGVDSAFTRADGTLVPISSKLGSGAKASFFSNFLPKIIGNMQLPSSVVRDLAQSARDVGVTKQMLDKKGGAKQTVYEYGIREICGLPKSKVPDTYQVFKDAKAKNITQEVILVMAAIVNNPAIPQNVKDQLPASITAAFTREIANRLNADAQSKDIITAIAAGKNFFQANLDLTKWKRGEVMFKLLNSGKANVSFIGNKAAIGDINAEQGMLNYALTYK